MHMRRQAWLLSGPRGLPAMAPEKTSMAGLLSGPRGPPSYGSGARSIERKASQTDQVNK